MLCKHIKTLALTAAVLLPLQAAYAVPNIWHADSRMGITEFNLINGRNQAISFSCNSGAEGFEEREPGFSYIPNWKNLHEDAELGEISILADGKYAVYPDPFHWSEFIKRIAKARTIEVFADNKKIAVFKPSPRSIRETARYIASDCRYDLWR
ncbi:hypothetical protein L1281_000973 [Neisseria sp. HSC-16F19]|nr:hypothetical protein [Neisseria sp. HSC-16F19]MCP2040390.1 hypothetical protein [Neisseria sp. HSC-16F19]